MVSFSCESCGDILTKKKLDPHRSRCRGATFTCIDCMVYFPGFEYRAHTSCMSEEQKYQGALYKPKKQQQQQQQQHHHHHHHHQQQQQQQQQQHQQRPARATETMNTLALQPSVEDVVETKPYETWHECEPRQDDGKSPAEPPPRAPTPPPAHEDDSINVFDFLVATGQTPSSSNVNVKHKSKPKEKVTASSTSLVRYQSPTAERLTDSSTKAKADYRTPSRRNSSSSSTSSRGERRKSKDSEVKKDKKRKRAHTDASGDHTMADAPPSLHTGLTGGLKSLMRLPPSPDLSGDNAPDSPSASPLKKSKHSKHSKSSHSTTSVSTNIFGIISSPGRTKSKSKKDKKDKEKDKSDKDKKTEKHSSSHRHKEKKPKLLDYKSSPKQSNEMIIFSPQVDSFLKTVHKGPESEKGCSMNKALKRFHREREASGSGMTKGQEEKELFKNLRMRRNDRGEIVLFTV